MEQIFIILNKISNTWSRIPGLIWSIITFIVVYYFICGFFLENNFDKLSIINLYILGGAAILIWLFWFFTTNRFCIKLPKTELQVAILIEVDDINIENRVRTVFKSLLKEIDNDNLKGFNIKLLPINYLNNQREIEKFLDTRFYSFDSIIRIEINSGPHLIKGSLDKFVDQLEVKKISYIGYFDPNIKEKKVFFDKININNDINLTNFHKDWNYIYTNEGKDKLKIKKNLKETIYHYCGIYAIYIEKHDLALNLLKSIFNPTQRTFNLVKGQKEIKLKPNNIVASRLAAIIVDLYSKTAFQKFNSDKKNEALKDLKECNKLMGSHPHSFPHFVSMARMCFETGDIQGAKDFTEKFNSLKPNSYEYYLNKSWFAILECDVRNIVIFFKKLKNKKFSRNANYMDLIDFYQSHKPNHPNSKIYIEFAEAFFYKMCIDPVEGNMLLLKTITELKKNNTINFNLVSLAEEVHRIGNTTVSRNKKPIPIKRKKSKRKKRRKKRA